MAVSEPSPIRSSSETSSSCPRSASRPNRARELHGVSEEIDLAPGGWLAILLEEVGEVARAMQDETPADVRKELIHVAAMTLRFANRVGLEEPAYCYCSSSRCEPGTCPGNPKEA